MVLVIFAVFICCGGGVVVSSILMAIDDENHWLATGDTDGMIKIWDVADYCIQPSDDVITKPPSQFTL